MSLKTTHSSQGLQRDQVHKGRGASLNLEGRFEQWQREALDDGWSGPNADGSDSTARPATVVTEEIAKSILSSNESPDIPFRYSVNPYRGCEHGCIYCFARPTHAYLGLSPGLDFETRIFAKTNAPELLRAALSKPGYRCDAICLGINTDAYQPCEREYQLTRRCIAIAAEFHQPLMLITKSALIERDIDLLTPMAEKKLVQVTISITTLDHAISRYLEPRTAAPARRLQTLQTLRKAGIPAGVLVAPVIPFITDHELERILQAARERGADYAGYGLLRLPWELKDLFRDWLTQHFPLKAAHVLSRIHEMRGGRDNDPRFGSRFSGEGVYADLLAKRHAAACRRLGFERKRGQSPENLTRKLFRVPGAAIQGSLF
ncbi:MAG: PA0069 family radical SAM protein [Betaproteobacteria bacterium]|nr:PA0069 family radical SAM protein [Betaproteobacteria bacterium]